MVESREYGNTNDGNPVTEYILSNDNELKVGILDYGGTITFIQMPDRNGEIRNLVITLGSIKSYEENNAYFGAIVGRYANRIGGGSFSLSGEAYQLYKNDNNNHLHGGKEGFDSKIWQVESQASEGADSLKLFYTSPDGEEGYPGELKVTVTYTLDEDNRLTIEYNAETSKPTVLNLTNHTYFNLNDNKSDQITNHIVRLDSAEYVPTNDQGIPKGHIASVENTPFDFRIAKPISRDIEADHIDIKNNRGFDHCFVLDNKTGRIAELSHPDNGLKVNVYTTQPGIQLYTGNFLEGSDQTIDGESVKYRCGVCLETEHYPDSPNQTNFPSTVLYPGENYYSKTVYEFESK